MSNEREWVANEGRLCGVCCDVCLDPLVCSGTARASSRSDGAQVPASFTSSISSPAFARQSQIFRGAVVEG